MKKPDHHVHGPSTLNNSLGCRGFESAPFRDNAAAEEGRFLHTCMETGDREGLDEEQLQCIDRIVTHLKTIVDESECEVHRELRVDIKLGNGHEIFGTADYVAFNEEGNSVGADWKFGRGSILDCLTDDGSIGNAQVEAYAVGIFDRFPQIKKLTFYVLIPRRDEIFSVTWTRDDLKRIRRNLTQLMDEITSPDPVLTPSTVCSYCAKKPTCPALAAKAVTLAKRLEPLSIPDNLDPATMTPEVLDGVALPAVRIITPWCRAVKQEATRLAMEGEDFENHKLVGRSRPIVFDNAQDIYESVKDLIPLDSFLQSTKVHLAPLRAEVRKLAPHGKKKTAVENLNERLSEFLPDDESNTTFHLRKK